MLILKRCNNRGQHLTQIEILKILWPCVTLKIHHWNKYQIEIENSTFMQYYVDVFVFEDNL